MNTDSIFNLVENTSRSIFLTGKAGTGKTTFLNNFVQKTRKKYIIVAPTGIAAINAGGVTIHSMFGLPLRTFIPTTERIDQNIANNIYDLASHFKYRKDKLKLLREIEIIIIDEVSMLRADVLDMMDFALRHIRRNQEPFGGVQMLFIGDLYQLPPVVRDENILLNYYKSSFFFDCFALRNLPLITIELTKIYRQKDEKFINILNAIRDGDRKNIDFEELNKNYNPNFEPDKENYVYLTSHNRIADEINQKKLAELKGISYFYDAKIIGDFRENQHPNDEKIELRVGAQIMFIRNDASGERKYYNGKLAEITRLSKDEIWVMIDGNNEEYKLKTEIWEQKKYSLDADKNIVEEVLGSFEQYPIRLAWAVTIHKSQGLTFDRLIVDAGKSFTAGQVYVALSRCRTLEGIVLKSKITPEIIFANNQVDSFQNSTNANDRVEEILEAEKYDYAIRRILMKLQPIWILKSLEDWYSVALLTENLDILKAKQMYFSLNPELKKYIEIYNKFEKVIHTKVRKFIGGKEDWQEIENKSKGAIEFFFNNIHNEIFEELKQFYAETKGVKGLKEFNEEMKIFINDLEDYLNDLKNISLLDKALFENKTQKVSTNIAKIPTHMISYQLFEEGKNLSQIADYRGLTISTIYGHFAKIVEQKDVDITRIINKEKLQLFEKTLEQTENQEKTLTEWKNILPDDFEYGEIRLLLNYFNSQSRTNTEEE